MIRSLKRFLTAFLTFGVALGIGLAMQYGDAVASRWASEEPVSGPGPEKAVSAQNVAAVVPLSMTMTFRPQGGSAQAVRAASVVGLPAEITAPNLSMLLAPDAEAVLVSPATGPVVIPKIAADKAPAVAIPAVVQITSPDSPSTTVSDITPVALTDAAPALATTAVAKPSMVEAVPDAPVVAETCTPKLTATPAPLAMITLNLTDTCRPDARVSVHHQGMMFSALTDTAGDLEIDVPALEVEAFFMASFEDGAGAVAMTAVPELAEFDRAVLQWQGQDEVSLHALEFGAAYAGEGHVWAGSTGNMANTVAGTGGFMITLGDEGLPSALMAEVYTFPSGYVAQDGAVALSVEAEVTSQNCGRDVNAQSIQIEPGEHHEALDLTMTMPDCDAIGEFLVLKNMFVDLKLAVK